MSDLKYSEISSILKKQLSDFKYESKLSEYGIIVQIGDGIVQSFGLNSAFCGEMVEFPNGKKGIVLNLEEDYVSIVLLSSSKDIKEGDRVTRTGKIFSIKVGEGMLGRIIDPLGTPIDGKGPIEGKLFEMPLERKAPGVIYREPVKEPLQTGIKFIDSMIPIGRGQRELIIGDRQTGKTTIAIDTIINQKHFFETDNPVYCIYVAIGQKGSTIARITKILEENGAIPYTIVVASSSSDPASIQVFSPFSGTAIGEYFRDTGRSSLVVYDDLSKQAVSYREISLLLRRSPGREAYPGDVFYLHSRLLERSAKIIRDQEIAEKMNDIPESIKNNIKGGGSLTAIPIIETQSGDVSAYIPTNVISITDGQIFLEKDLFLSGIRPAINESISVSRVGGSAQIESMRKISGSLKIDQAQFRELESFSKFGSELDPTTIKIIQKGKRNIEILKQKPHNPYNIYDQIAIIYAGTKNLLKDIPIENVSSFEKEFIFYLNEKHKSLLNSLKNGILDKKSALILENVAMKLSQKYLSSS
ncbi:MAG: F0F1 ATP synthase subunit alpha [Flavobacteriales bacterium]|jgi:F-type H+-transporting ATPase subunit alpha|uniref:F0F1 ATP synthase subunit alpha n=1 Tax=Blattabacterium sp. (Mastotermes darwiniensis) TaxID=39768 RepID=UPI000231DE18|nr:F0F1 ATP synthase subunit alpha [Blattabacterium sp. (Mastotermes darwiniensis)]AER40588.1 ATP synthase F1 subunit alpha [Blattabacterium sp. (Mastotermes darwiniensis) str. MADAR]MDR1805085.1 F0F1 ATP synthase subunit alpha [Flavobacteriales bacterium]